MQVGVISNNQIFSGKIKKTEKGNEYEKSNEGKKYAPLCMFASTGISMAIDKALDKFSPAGYLLFEAKNGNKNAYAAIAGTVVIIGAISIGIGAIIDAIINKTRRNDTDKFAKTGEISKKTNKGKINGAIIGIGTGALSLLLSHKPLRTMGASGFKVVPMEIASWAALGAIYDHGVNKFRAQLDKKEQKIDKEEIPDEKITEKAEESEEATVKKSH